MPGDFRWLAVNTRVHTYYNSAHEAADASGARHSPRPLFSGRRLIAHLGRIAPRECERVSEIGCLKKIKSAHARTRHLSPCGRGRIASSDAIRVRGYALTIDLNPSPPPSPTRGEGAHHRCRDIDAFTAARLLRIAPECWPSPMHHRLGDHAVNALGAVHGLGHAQIRGEAAERVGVRARPGA